MNKDSPEINERPDLENQNFDKKFRRTNDVIQYQVFVSILKAYEKTIIDWQPVRLGEKSGEYLKAKLSYRFYFRCTKAN